MTRHPSSLRCSCGTALLTALLTMLALVDSVTFAQVRPSSSSKVQTAPAAEVPMRIPELTAPVLRAAPAADPIPGVSVGQPVLRLPSLDNPALDAAVERLRASALTTPMSGQRDSRSAANASWVLGLLHVHGIGVVSNLADAAFWFERARAQGEPLAAAGLAWCAIEGCVGTPNSDTARQWINVLRRTHLPRAQYLQWLLESRLVPLQIATPSLALGSGAAISLPGKALLMSAAQGGDIHALIELGLESLGAGRKEEALAWFRAAAPRSPAAEATVALLADPVRNSAEITKPLELVSAQDSLNRARRSHRGDGQPANFVEAIRLYRLAQSQGSPQAGKMLELIFSRPGVDGQIDIGWMQQLAYADLSKEMAVLGSNAERRAFNREVTPLIDLLPPVWKKYSPGNLNIATPPPGRPR